MGGGRGDDLTQAAEDLRAFGATPEELERLFPNVGGEQENFEVWRTNEETLRLFLASGTQWRVGGMAGVVTGLDYAGVRAAAIMAGIEVTEDRFEGLRAMETAALETMGKRR